jgi:preprotein translocase subunit SecG
MNKVTTVIALSFFVTSLSLAYISSNKSSGSKSLINDTVQEETIDKQEEFNKP